MLSYLKRLPVDYIKIDRSFVGGLEDDPRAEGLVSAVIGSAHTPGLEAVAEGAEAGEQLARLRELRRGLVWGHLPLWTLPLARRSGGGAARDVQQLLA